MDFLVSLFYFLCVYDIYSSFRAIPASFIYLHFFLTPEWTPAPVVKDKLVIYRPQT